MRLRDFLVRSPARDSETDRRRFGRLFETLDNIGTEIEAERAGLRGRYENACSDAAFAMQAFEAERDGSASCRIDEMTRGIVRYSARLAELDRQVQLLDRLRTVAEGPVEAR